MDHEQLRREYGRATLIREDLDKDPLVQFQSWFDDAREAGLYLPDAMVLATVDDGGAPNARVVVLRGIEEDALLFYTSYASAKGRELAHEPRAALVFHWNALERQVRVRGAVEKTLPEESDGYHARRPRPSQLSASVSPQSEVVPDRATLQKRYDDLARALDEEPVPRPADWGGYRLRVETVEFWQGRESRLHDRFRYRRGDGGWIIERLAP